MANLNSYETLTDCLNTLVKEDTVFAVGSEKDWNSVPVRVYLEANARASKRGELIRRIFCETKEEVIAEARYQARIGIQVRHRAPTSTERFIASPSDPDRSR